VTPPLARRRGAALAAAAASGVNSAWTAGDGAWASQGLDRYNSLWTWREAVSLLWSLSVTYPASSPFSFPTSPYSICVATLRRRERRKRQPAAPALYYRQRCTSLPAGAALLYRLLSLRAGGRGGSENCMGATWRPAWRWKVAGSPGISGAPLAAANARARAGRRAF